MTNFLTGKRVHTLFIGIDNGSSGSIGFLGFNRSGMCVVKHFMKTPTVMKQNYTKKKGNISQLDFSVLRPIFREVKDIENVISAMERPMTGKFFKVMLLSARVHQQWMDIYEFFRLQPPTILDSKEWQSVVLPKGLKGSSFLKKASVEVGQKLFGKVCTSVKHDDYDGMLICEFLRRRHTLV